MGDSHSHDVRRIRRLLGEAAIGDAQLFVRVPVDRDDLNLLERHLGPCRMTELEDGRTLIEPAGVELRRVRSPEPDPPRR